MGNQIKYEILIEEFFSQKQIHTIVSGQMNAVKRDEVINETLQIMRKENISNVIWDIRDVHLEYSLIGSHLIIEKITDFGLRLGDHVAVVYRNNKNQHAHADNVAYNKGLEIKYFRDDLESARKWLSNFDK